MYGRARGKGYEVRLVRVSAWDSRTCAGSRAGLQGRAGSNSRAGRIAAVLMTAILTLSICLSVLYFCLLPGDTVQAENTAASSGNTSFSGGSETETTQISQQEVTAEAEPEPTPEPEPKTPLIVLDPGHGGEDEGCMREDALEKEINLEIAMRTAARLREMGFDVVLTREDNDTGLTLE